MGYVLWVVDGYVVGVEGRVRGVDCVCATEPPCSSGNNVGAAGCAALAGALEKNTTLQTLYLNSECVVLCCVICFLRGVDCGFMFCGVVVLFGLGWRGVCVVLIVCAPLKRCVHQSTKWATLDVRRWLALWRRTRHCRS